MAELRGMKLQAIPNTITKVIQLYETKNSRHSVMIVGETLTAKSVCWRTLQSAMSRLNKEGDENYQVVKVGDDRTRIENRRGTFHHADFRFRFA